MLENSVFELLEEIRPENDFRSSADFIAEGLLDSFDIVQLVNSLDERFNISIDGIDILPENFNSAGKIIELLYKNGISNAS
jgi:acyl carrier protein